MRLGIGRGLARSGGCLRLVEGKAGVAGHSCRDSLAGVDVKAEIENGPGVRVVDEESEDVICCEGVSWMVLRGRPSHLIVMLVGKYWQKDSRRPTGRTGPVNASLSTTIDALVHLFTFTRISKTATVF